MSVLASSAHFWVAKSKSISFSRSVVVAARKRPPAKVPEQLSSRNREALRASPSGYRAPRRRSGCCCCPFLGFSQRRSTCRPVSTGEMPHHNQGRQRVAAARLLRLRSHRLRHSFQASTQQTESFPYRETRWVQPLATV